MNKTFRTIFFVLSFIFGIIGLIAFFVIVFNSTFRFNETSIVDADLASKFGDFFGGVVGTIFSVLSVFLLVYTILHQKNDSRKSALENNFFRMIDYHNNNVAQLKVASLKAESRDVSEGRRAFVQFKIQIHRLFEVVNQVIVEQGFKLDKEQKADIVYIIFYYGIEGSWVSFIDKKLERYALECNSLASLIQDKINSNKQLKIDRTNQTYLSTYFRNMYNCIKMVDEAPFLSEKEKRDLIKIYRAQLSNPELYVLFFNVMSRFGKKWREMHYITKYELLKNIPHSYCEDYVPGNYFQMEYEEDEY